ncbi:MAG: tandem-95 repeat protein [Gammaproteobacteria bacterium]|jgi:outer membrane protein OmpA-like peptidoglycan-associated protein|nr:tandem-95 repeat protein [Gammaproteobacteria bacterium]
MLRKLILSVLLAQGLITVAVAQDEGATAAGQAGTPTFHFIGDRYRVGIGLDSEFDVIGEFQAALFESERSSFIGDGWLGSEGAGGVKLNYHWLINATSEEGPDGPVYTDGNVAKLFMAADQNQFEDRKLTFGGGWEGRRWAFSGYGMTALSDERLVDRTTSIEEQLVTGQIDGRNFSRVDTIETVTELFEEPYEWGLGARAERFFEDPLVRLRAGLDYEEGDFSSSQLTASLSLDKHFHNSPHSLSFRTSYAHKDGDFVLDDSDLRGSVVYSFSFGAASNSFRPSRRYRDIEVEVAGEPRSEERVVVNEVTLTDRTTFDFDSSVLKPAAENTLDEILAMVDDGGLVGDIQIVGHTCDIGTEAYNQGLSERRARSVVDYLTARGVESGRIDWRGEGETEPRFPNDGEENRSRNRRVEISFVTERSSSETVTVGPDEPATEIRQVEVPVEAPWIRRALRNPVQHKRIVDYYRYQESTTSVTEGEIEFENEAPQAADDQFSVDVDSADNLLDVLANDSDADGDVLTIIGVTAPGNGSASVSGDAISYTPAGGFVGTDSFSYTVEDGFGGESTATVTVTVDSPNQAPSVENLSVSTLLNEPVDVDVLAAATDPDGDPIDIASFGQPANGTVTRVGDVLRYQPAADFVGEDSFSFTIADDRGGETTGSVAVEVVAENRAPVANPDTATTTVGEPVTVDVLANDFDPDGDPLEVIEIVQWYGVPAEITDNGDGTITFRVSDTCNGRNEFRYTITDPQGLTATANVSVTRVSGGDTEDASLECLHY